jgi:hypothetical protein
MADGWPMEEALSLKAFRVGDPAIDRARSIMVRSSATRSHMWRGDFSRVRLSRGVRLRPS